jgi:hypothetical protein
MILDQLNLHRFGEWFDIPAMRQMQDMQKHFIVLNGRNNTCVEKFCGPHELHKNSEEVELLA